ncbi:transcription elongation factor spt4 [Phlyctochytrium planicorne]|nr:transcription elongation factor spt4 [Phlyctochytrium planicorne]
MASQTHPYLPPDSSKKSWRACLNCGMIKTKEQFRRDGCDNCEEILQLKGSSAHVQECTSTQFEGVIALMTPPGSWVAKWQRCDKFQKGLYAMRISGRLPEDVIEDMREKGFTYRPRDGSAKD